MNVSSSQPQDRSASATPLQLSQFPVDKVSPYVDGRIILTQQRAPYVPPDAAPPSRWSVYTARGTGRSRPDGDPIHSQGPSHFSGLSDYDGHTRGGSRDDAAPSFSSHDSRGSMLASQGILRRGGVGPNTGVSSVLLQSDRVETNLDSTFQRASSQRADVPPPSPQDHGCTPQEFLVKQTAMLTTFPRLSRIQVLHGPVPEDKLDTIRDVVHPDDWPRFVLGDIIFRDMRFHKNFMLLPRFADHKLAFDDSTMLTTDVDPSMIPITDRACSVLNRGLYKANAKAVKRRMMQATMGPAAASEKAEAYRYVTLISDKSFISGCKEEPPNPAPANPDSHSPRRPSHMSASVNLKSEERLTTAAVRERCTTMLSSTETTYSLAVGVCGFDHVHVKQIRDFNQLSTHEFYRAPIRTVLFDYDKCESTCPMNCNQHGIAAPAGYCKHCDRPLSVVTHKLHLNVGPFGTAKPFETNALLMKRVCEGSKYCPGSKVAHHAACESAPNSSYALKGDRDRSHFSKNMWIHELLIDVMVHYSKHSDIVSEYMKVFRDAVLLRHVNLFHQTRFEQERDALQINTSDIDTMTSALFTRPDGLGRDADDTGFNGDFTDTPATKRKRQQFNTVTKNSRSHATQSYHR